MSDERQILDFYESEAWMVHSLMNHMGSYIYGRIFCPCAGEGAIAGPISKYQDVKVVTADVDRTRKVDFYGDATSSPLWDNVTEQGPVDWTVDNPPFNSAFFILKQAIRSSRRGVALLLNITFIEPTQERGYWLQHNPPDVAIILPRHSFLGTGKTAQTTVAWYVWMIQPAYLPNQRIVVDFQAKHRHAPSSRSSQHILTD